MPLKRRRTSVYRRPMKRRKLFHRKKRTSFKGRKTARVRRGRRMQRKNISATLFNRKQFTTMEHRGVIPITGAQYIAATVPTVFSAQLRANSIYDPNYSSITGSWNGVAASHMFWSKIFNHYTVLGASVTYTLTQESINAASTSNHALVWGVKLDNDAVFNAGSKQWMFLCQDKNTKYRYFHPDQQGGKSQKIRHFYSAKKFFNMKTPQTNESVGAAFGTNPSDQAYFIPWMQLMDYGTPPASGLSWKLSWHIKYFVCLQEPKDIDDVPADMAMAQDV